MSYTPVNQDMYLAAYAGALAGMGASQRVPTNTLEASYAGLAVIAGAYAESFDASWNDAAQANTLEIDSAKALSEATWQTRGPTSATVVTLTSTNYDGLTASLCAMIRAAGTYLAGQGITPSNPGGGTLAGDVTGAIGNNAVESLTGVTDTVQVLATTMDLISPGVEAYHTYGPQASVASDPMAVCINAQNSSTALVQGGQLNLSSGNASDPDNFYESGYITFGTGIFTDAGFRQWASIGGGAPNYPTEVGMYISGGFGINTNWNNDQSAAKGLLKLGRTDGGINAALFAAAGSGIGTTTFDGLSGLDLIKPVASENVVQIGDTNTCDGILLASSLGTIEFTGDTAATAGAIVEYAIVNVNGAARKIAIYATA